MKTIMKGAFFGGTLAYLWGLFSWFVIPWHHSAFEKFPNEGFVQWILKENAPVKGVYLIPYPFDGGSTNTDGPLVMATIDPQGGDAKMTGLYISSFLVQVLIAAILTSLIKWLPPTTFFRRVYFITLIGLVMGLVAYLPGVPGWNWWGFSRSYFFIMLSDVLLTTFLMGLGIAFATRQPSTQV